MADLKTKLSGHESGRWNARLRIGVAVAALALLIVMMVLFSPIGAYHDLSVGEHLAMLVAILAFALLGLIYGCVEIARKLRVHVR